MTIEKKAPKIWAKVGRPLVLFSVKIYFNANIISQHIIEQKHNSLHEVSFTSFPKFMTFFTEVKDKEE